MSEPTPGQRALLSRNVLIHDEDAAKRLRGAWVCVPREDFHEALAALDELESLRAASEAAAPALARAEKAEAALREISAFAQAHHGDQQPHFWLHALLVDIPSMVEIALAAASGDEEARRGR